MSIGSDLRDDCDCDGGNVTGDTGCNEPDDVDVDSDVDEEDVEAGDE